jgi:threonyl-tRNA synthetase
MSDNSLEIKRHSFAHVMAAAVKKMFPEAKFGVGPVIENGCYYDFILPRTLIPEDLEIIEKHIKDLLRRNLSFKVQDLSIEEATLMFEKLGQPLKVELLRDLATKGTTSLKEEEAEILDANLMDRKITIYRLEDNDTGEDLFIDLCRGPHIKSVDSLRPLGFTLDKFSAAYWRGDQERNISMQRIYALVFEDQPKLSEFITQREEAQKRDHRKLGKELELFMTHEEIGAGLPIYLPKGAVLRQVLEQYMNQKQKEQGYQYVYTPHIGKEDLFQRSGHLDHYAENMYAPLEIDQEKFYLKPMNCPFHHHIYLSKPRSYRDLPFKLSEYGTVYRYEESGVLSGLIRVRGFTQNDAHVYCTKEQITDVFVESLNSYVEIYKDLGIVDYEFRFSLPDFDNEPDKFGQHTVEWDEAVAAIQKALDITGVKYYKGVGEAAFYGPKIDVQVKNVNGKEDTLSTIQVDMSIAPKFDITYTAEDGSQKAPAIMHRALMGSIDRFMAFLIEMHGGRFPFWLAPTQIKILTINDEVLPYVDKIKEVLNQVVLMKPLKYNELRYEVDERSESLGKKIREAEMEKIPVILIVGPKDQAAGQVSVRTQEGEKKVELAELKRFLESL